jgi:hypothetical protein
VDVLFSMETRSTPSDVASTAMASGVAQSNVSKVIQPGKALQFSFYGYENYYTSSLYRYEIY